MNYLKVALAVVAFFLVVCPETQAQGLQKITSYVQNPTSRSISFLFRKGTDPWATYTVKSGHTYTMTGIAPHTIKYNNGDGEDKTFNLRHGKTYYFAWEGGALQFYTRK